MKTKHTPGPWINDKYCDKVSGVESGQKICDLAQYEYMNDFKLKIIPTGRRRSTAKLIAAAPDLLEVCINFKKFIEDGFDYNGSKTYQILDEVDQAIKKATE